MEVRKLALSEMSDIYTLYMTKDFPAAELKPFSSIRHMSEKGLYDGYGLFENGLKVYGYFVSCPETGDLLMDYLAVTKGYRGRGYGSRFLSFLPRIIGDHRALLIEIEHPEKTDDPEERKKRLRRRRFYLENGVHATQTETKVFGVDYQILQYTRAADLSDPEVRNAIDALYRNMFPAGWMGTKVIV